MSDHWYDKDGNPHHWVEKKSGGGTRATTIKDAREHGWLPSVSAIVNVASKPQLERWKILQACTAVLTSPRRDGEGLDAFMDRVLFVDKEGEQEAKKAADRGTAIHDAVALAIKSEPFDEQWKPYVESAFRIINMLGKILWSEKVLVGYGYAGRADLLLENGKAIILPDIKTAKTMPKSDSWDSHKLQTAAYAAALGNTGDKPIITANIYLSTVNPGEAVYFLQDKWRTTYVCGFKPLLDYWCFANDFYPGRIKP